MCEHNILLFDFFQAPSVPVMNEVDRLTINFILCGGRFMILCVVCIDQGYIRQRLFWTELQQNNCNLFSYIGYKTSSPSRNSILLSYLNLSLFEIHSLILFPLRFIP